MSIQTAASLWPGLQHCTTQYDPITFNYRASINGQTTEDGVRRNIAQHLPSSRTPTPSAPERHLLNVEHFAPGLIDDPQTSTPSAQGAPGASAHPPSVLVSEIPGARPLTVMSIAHALTWPADRVHLLQPYGLDGDLFTSPDGQLYAHVEGEGHILVERQNDGRYQIPFGFSPQLPGPFLSKSERQPTWKIERPAWLTQGLVSDPLHTAVGDPPRPEAPTYLAPADAARLTPAAATPDGIRYDKHRKTYVDTAEGTVMVRKKCRRGISASVRGGE